MSYARFGWEGSDVYVFASSHALECCGCRLQEVELVEDPASFLGGYLKPVGEVIETNFTSNEEMIEHLLVHRAAGHTVPEDALERLRDPEDARHNSEMWAETRAKAAVDDE